MEHEINFESLNRVETEEDFKGWLNQFSTGDKPLFPGSKVPSPGWGYRSPQEQEKIRRERDESMTYEEQWNKIYGN